MTRRAPTGAPDTDGAPTAIAIPFDLLLEIAAHARAAYPIECCGYLLGAAAAFGVDELIRCTNANPVPDAFAIDGAELFAFARTFRTARPARILYHSHPNGRAYFSETDRARATDAGYPVQHLVVGVSRHGATEAAQFGEDFAELARFPAAMLR